MWTYAGLVLTSTSSLVSFVQSDQGICSFHIGSSFSQTYSTQILLRGQTQNAFWTRKISQNIPPGVSCLDPTLIRADPPFWSPQTCLWLGEPFIALFGHFLVKNGWIKKGSLWIKSFLNPMDQIHVLVFTKWQLWILYRRLTHCAATTVAPPASVHDQKFRESLWTLAKQLKSGVWFYEQTTMALQSRMFNWGS